MNTSTHSQLGRVHSFVGRRRIVLPFLLLGLLQGCAAAEPEEGGEELGSAEQAFSVGNKGGFVIVSGDDADDSGHCHGKACGGIYVEFLKRAVLESKTAGTGILAIGVNGSYAKQGLESWNNPLNGGPGAAITYVTATAAIESEDFSKYAVIYIPSASTETSGGISSAQVTSLNKRQPDIANFVNMQGGSLVALTQAGLQNGWGFLPIALTTQPTSFDKASPTADLLEFAPNVTSALLSHCCYHNVFTGPAGYSGLKVLATHNSGGAYANMPVILGGLSVVITAEICNDGKDNDGDGNADGADQDCWVCGDGDIDPPEQCDDGKDPNGPCSDSCTLDNQPPVAVCQDVTTCNDAGLCSAAVSSLGAGSSDPNGDPITISQSPAGPYAVGTHSVQVSVSDGSATATCGATVNVNDCEPPAISCPASFSVECASNGQAPVTPPPASATDNCSASVTGPAAGSFPVGSTQLTYTAIDPAGNQASCNATVEVVDTTPPQVSVGNRPALWAPNHKREEVSLADCGIVVQDGCGGAIDPATANATITCVTSDEPVNTRGDGNTDPDIVIIDGDTVALRPERMGNGDGRVYQIHFQVTDGAGNVAQGVCPVGVPHSRNGEPAVDSGDAYQVCTQ